MSVRRLVVVGLFVFFLIIGGLAALSFYKLSDSAGELHALLPATNELSYPIALLGDSLAEGAGASSTSNNLAAQLLTKTKGIHPKATIDNFGTSGATIGTVLDSQLPKIQGRTYRLVVVVAGTNDILQQTSYEVLASQYQQLLQKLPAPARQVIIANIPNFSETDAIPPALKPMARTRTTEANDLLKKYSKKTTGVTVFDFYSLSSKFLQPNSIYLSEDSFHPNDQGYAKLARAIAELVK